MSFDFKNLNYTRVSDSYQRLEEALVQLSQKYPQFSDVLNNLKVSVRLWNHDFSSIYEKDGFRGVALLGPMQAGKSTVLNSLFGANVSLTGDHYSKQGSTTPCVMKFLRTNQKYYSVKINYLTLKFLDNFFVQLDSKWNENGYDDTFDEYMQEFYPSVCFALDGVTFAACLSEEQKNILRESLLKKVANVSSADYPFHFHEFEDVCKLEFFMSELINDPFNLFIDSIEVEGPFPNSCVPYDVPWFDFPGSEDSDRLRSGQYRFFVDRCSHVLLVSPLKVKYPTPLKRLIEEIKNFIGDKHDRIFSLVTVPAVMAAAAPAVSRDTALALIQAAFKGVQGMINANRKFHSAILPNVNVSFLEMKFFPQSQDDFASFQSWLDSIGDQFHSRLEQSASVLQSGLESLIRDFGNRNNDNSALATLLNNTLVGMDEVVRLKIEQFISQILSCVSIPSAVFRTQFDSNPFNLRKQTTNLHSFRAMVHRDGVYYFAKNYQPPAKGTSDVLVCLVDAAFDYMGMVLSAVAMVGREMSNTWSLFAAQPRNQVLLV